jgi:hypothetical protein
MKRALLTLSLLLLLAGTGHAQHPDAGLSISLGPSGSAIHSDGSLTSVRSFGDALSYDVRFDFGHPNVFVSSGLDTNPRVVSFGIGVKPTYKHVLTYASINALMRPSDVFAAVEVGAGPEIPISEKFSMYIVGHALVTDLHEDYTVLRYGVSMAFRIWVSR